MAPRVANAVSCNLPLNSAVFQLPEVYRNGVVTVKTDGNGNYQCPVRHCNRHFNLISIKQHLTKGHYDFSLPRLSLDEDRFHQPDWLETTGLYVDKVTKRVICSASLIVLRRDQILEHIYCCPACWGWKRAYNPPEPTATTSNNLDDEISNDELDVFNEKQIPSAIVTNQRGKIIARYRLHTPFVFTTTKGATDNDVSLTSKDRYRANQEVKCKLNIVTDRELQLVNPDPSAIVVKPFADQIAIHIESCMRYFDLCTFGMQRSVVDRIGHDHKWHDEIYNPESGFWFAKCQQNTQLASLPYDLQDAVELEAGMAGFEQVNFNVESATQIRIELVHYLSSMLVVLLGTVKAPKIHENKYRNDNPAKIRDMRFDENGHMQIRLENKEFATIPWCIAELFTRYLLILRPLQAKYDGEVYSSNLMFPTHIPATKRPIIFGRTQRMYRDGEMSNVGDLRELRRKQGMDLSQADAIIKQLGGCLVDYYTVPSDPLCT